MKKILLSAGLLFLVQFSMQAQRNPYNPIRTGIKAGANMSTFIGGQSQDFLPGYHVGGSIELPLTFNKRIGLQFELMYSAQGYKGKEYPQTTWNDDTVEGAITLENARLHYIYLPVTFKIYATDKLAFNVGGQIGSLVGSSGGLDIHKASPAREYLNMAQSNLDQFLFEQGYRSTDPKDYYETLDYGVHAGISYDFSSGLYLEGRFYYGLQDVYKKDNELNAIPMPDRPPGISDDDYRLIEKRVNYLNDNLKFDPLSNIVIQLSVGYRF